jgi:hypothetical protein
MQSPSGQPLAAGIFNRAQGWPVQTSSQPGLNVDWNSNGCAATGRFAIGQVVLDASGNLQKFHAAFEQHCDHSSAALRGTIWIDMQGSTTPPAPPVLPAVTTPTTFFSFTSDPGDVLGNGGSGSFALANSTFVASGESTQVSVRVAPNGTPFFFRFKSPNGQVLQPGTYDPVAGNLSSAGAALFTTGPGAVCSGTVSGRFTILEYVYGTQGDLYSFHATFELRCGTATAAFRGEIQVMADPWR